MDDNSWCSDLGYHHRLVIVRNPRCKNYKTIAVDLVHACTIAGTRIYSRMCIEPSDVVLTNQIVVERIICSVVQEKSGLVSKPRFVY